VSTAMTATAVISIDPAAARGARDVTLTTNLEVAKLTDGFTVVAGIATILGVTPNTGQQGQQNLSVAITGQFTHFMQGTTTASFGDGISVGGAAHSFGPVTVTSPTSATATLNISNRPNWSQLDTSGTAPAKRSYHSFIYDKTSNQGVLFGGDNFALR